MSDRTTGRHSRVIACNKARQSRRVRRIVQSAGSIRATCPTAPTCGSANSVPGLRSRSSTARRHGRSHVRNSLVSSRRPGRSNRAASPASRVRSRLVRSPAMSLRAHSRSRAWSEAAAARTGPRDHNPAAAPRAKAAGSSQGTAATGPTTASLERGHLIRPGRFTGPALLFAGGCWQGCATARKVSPMEQTVCPEPFE